MYLIIIGVVPLTMKSLGLLKWLDEQDDIQRFRLGRRVCEEWEQFGMLLGCTRGQLESWRAQCDGDAYQCWISVMEYWLAGGSVEEKDYPTTWEGLYTLLEDCEYGDVTEELKRG
jgi:hypothetical protein